MTQQHKWVVMTTAPINVVADDRGEPMVFDVIPHDPGESVYGCIKCHEPLESAFNTPCSGEES